MKEECRDARTKAQISLGRVCVELLENEALMAEHYHERNIIIEKFSEHIMQRVEFDLEVRKEYCRDMQRLLSTYYNENIRAQLGTGVYEGYQKKNRDSVLLKK